MKISLIFISLAFFVLAPISTTHAQNNTSAAETVERLQAQLRDVEERETTLQARADELNEALIPENIERYFRGGSTRPEEQREQRRRQLSKEKDGVLVQLGQLTVSRTRLEMAIRNAESLAYQQSAYGVVDTQIDKAFGADYLVGSRWPVGALAFIILSMGIATLVLVIRKRKPPRPVHKH